MRDLLIRPSLTGNLDLLDHPTSQRWTAMKLSKTKPPSNDYNLLSADAIMLKETEGNSCDALTAMRLVQSNLV